MSVIGVKMFKGRPREQKAATLRELTDAFIRPAGVGPEGIHGVISEAVQEDRGTGGVLVADRGATSLP